MNEKSYCWRQEGNDEEYHFGFSTIEAAIADIREYADPIDGDGINKYYVYEAKAVNPFALTSVTILLGSISDQIDCEDESPLEESWGTFLGLSNPNGRTDNELGNQLAKAIANIYETFAKENNLPTWYTTTGDTPVAEVIPT